MAMGRCQEADGGMENSLQFWSYSIAKTVFPGIVNPDMLNEWLPAFCRPQKNARTPNTHSKHRDGF